LHKSKKLGGAQVPLFVHIYLDFFFPQYYIKIMELTLRQLKKWWACEKGLRWFDAHNLKTVEQTFDKLMEDSNYLWVDWLLRRTLKDCLKYTKNAAKVWLQYHFTRQRDSRRVETIYGLSLKYLDSGDIVDLQNLKQKVFIFDTLYIYAYPFYGVMDFTRTMGLMLDPPQNLQAQIIDFGLKLYKY